MGAEGHMEITELCDRCTGCGAGSDEQTLYDLAHMDDRTLSGLTHDSQYNLKGLHEKAWEHAQKRLSRLRGTIEARRGELRDLKEAFSYRLAGTTRGRGRRRRASGRVSRGRIPEAP